MKKLKAVPVVSGFYKLPAGSRISGIIRLGKLEPETFLLEKIKEKILEKEAGGVIIKRTK